METTLFLDPAFQSAGMLEFSLVDAAGKLVMTRSAKLQHGDERQSLDVREIAAGNYFLQVSWMGQKGVPEQASFKLQKLR